MIGIINIIGTIAGIIYSNVKIYFENNKLKAISSNNDVEYYMDAKGNYRDKKTDKILYVKYSEDKYGTIITICNSDYIPIAYPTLRKREEEICNFKKEFNTIFPYEDVDSYLNLKRTKHINKYDYGKQEYIWFDRKTQKNILIRNFIIRKQHIMSNVWHTDSICIYMDCDNGQILRIADNTLFELSLLEYKFHTQVLDMNGINQLINQTNIKQKEMMEQCLLNNQEVSIVFHSYGDHRLSKPGYMYPCHKGRESFFDDYDMSVMFNQIMHREDNISAIDKGGFRNEW